MDSNAPYIASLTREPFMYYEMKITAKLLEEGLSEKEAIEKIFKENLYQYPTERSLKMRARACIKRLNALEDEELVSWIINRPLDISRQVCLYAMMKDSRLIWEFMITVIGEKYRTRNFSYSRMDLNVFFTRLQEQNNTVASWSDSTINKLKSVLGGLLKENGYIDKTNSKSLNEVLLDYKLKDKIIENGDATCLPAFNYFE
jgi:pyruvate dehydrogenase complex dehydrogenase (E1) component